MGIPLDIKPMLAKLADDVPDGDGWIFEPKWDGFRCLIHRRGDDLHVISRDGRSLGRYFPEVIELLTGLIDSDCVLDGEIVVASKVGLEFEELQLRIHPAESRVNMLAGELPASVVLFDALELGGDLIGSPLSERLAALHERFGAPSSIDDILDEATRTSKLLMTPMTTDPEEARTWLTKYEDRGLDGVVAKRTTDTYQPNKRSLLKIKRKRTADCVVGGYRLSKDKKGVGSLLLGLYDDDGVLQYVGHTSGFKAAERVELLDVFKDIEGGESFGEGRSPGGQSRWSAGKDPEWVPLEPVLVCEVSYDRIMGRRFRHAVGFVRWRTDKAVQDCDFSQTD